MQKRYISKLTGLMLLGLIGWLPIMAQVKNSVEIKSMEQLQEILSSPQMRSDVVEDVKIAEEGILVDKLL